MRPPATIVIPAWGEWALTRACLETLRPTLAVRDQVVVVVNDCTDESAAGLRRYSWVTVVSQEHPASAAGLHAGAAVATGEVVVFLDSDTLLPSRWLDGLLAPFADASVSATGPRCNSVPDPQLVEAVPYAADRTADLQRFARLWRHEHRGRTTQVERLAGSSLAVRRQSFEAVGGFHASASGGADVDDLCRRLIGIGGRLLIAHESFVHHGHCTSKGDVRRATSPLPSEVARSAIRGGHRRGGSGQSPLLSACMIVKDEEDNLPRCLAALDGLVDEIVIYDTGSTDSTVRLARAAGAEVIVGYWDDDFARARNMALDACSGEWILHVDADEVVEADQREVRRELRTANSADAMTVAIGNEDNNGTIAVWHNAIRLFRRGRARWRGRLHEQLTPLHGEGLQGWPSSLCLRHTGYTDAAVITRDKMERNLRVAQLGVRDNGEGDASSLINLGRSLIGVGRYAEAVEHFARAVEVTDHRSLLRQASRFAVESLLATGRPAEALDWLPRLRAVSGTAVMSDYFEGLARLNLRDSAGALACFDRITDTHLLHDEDMAIPGHFLATRKGLALIMAERFREAADALLPALDGKQTSQALWAPLLEAYVQGELDLDELLAADPDPRCLNVMAHTANVSPAAAQALATYLWQTPFRRPAVVALLTQLAPRLPLQTVLDWAVALRGAGFLERCPLRVFAESSVPPALERLKAVAVLVSSLGDTQPEELVDMVSADLGDSDISAGLLILDALAPSVIPVLLTKLVSDPRRVTCTAHALDEVGAHEQAELLRELSAV